MAAKAEFKDSAACAKQHEFLQGLCMEMCPKRERNLREKQRRLHPFEKSDVKQPVDVVVKEYSRPAAGRQLEPRDLRPAPVLVKTLNYLLTDVLNKPRPWYYKCEFISDRIRSIRQDLTAQNIENFEAIDILEKATRYYLVMAVTLSQEPLQNYDPVLHYTHMKECLKKLLDLYQLHKLNYNKKSFRNEASFQACDLILHLQSPDICHRVLKLDNCLRKCKEIQLAIHIIKLNLNGNFIGVFRAASKLPYLESCAFFCNIQPIRCQGLSIMNTAFSSKHLSYPLTLLADNFYFDSYELAAEFCVAHNILIKDRKVFFNKGQFVETDQHKSYVSHKLIGSKMKNDISHVILNHNAA
jgi:SAC3 domain-containing protein 1